MEIPKVNPSSHNAKPNPTKTTQTKRLRRPSTTTTTTTGDGPIPQRKRLRLSPTCYPAFFHLKQELGYRSDADVLQWLIHQSRPQLLPAPSPPNSSGNRPSRNSVSKPLCMQYRITDNLASASSPAPSTPRSPIRATVVQASTVFFDTPATLDKAERLIATAAAYGSQLVVFPEAFIGGYPRLMMRFEGDDLQKYRASAVDVPGPEIERLGKIAGKHKVHLVMGVVERTKCCLFSTVVFFDSNGNRLGKQQKLMLLPSETAIWHSGKKSRFPVFPTSIGKIGGLTCWDNKSPFLRSELYAHGVELYCAPSSDEREMWKASMIHVAVEGCCFVLSANQFCRRQDYPLRQGEDVSAEEVACFGGSLIVSPSGNVLAGPNYQGECLISADLDTREIEKAKIEFGVVRNSFKPNHDDLIASEADQSLISVEVKQVPDLLSCDLVA